MFAGGLAPLPRALRTGSRLRGAAATAVPISLRSRLRSRRSRPALSEWATQEDILRLKAWILAGVLGGMAIAATLAATIARLFLQEPAP